MTLTLLALGIGLIIAILSFGDRIKNTRLREHERTLSRKLKTDWDVLRPLLRKDEPPDKKLSAIGLVILNNDITLDISALELFEKADERRLSLKKIHSFNYLAVISLTFAILVAIPLDLFLADCFYLPIINSMLSKETFFIMTLMLMSLFIVGRLIFTKIKEDKYLNLLEEIGDKL